jgi:hypothetical protein
MKPKLLILLGIALLILSCSKEDTFIFENKLLKSYENTYGSEKMMFFYNNDSSLTKIEYLWFDTIRITIDFFHNENNQMISIETFTSEYLFGGGGFFRIPFHYSIIPYYNDLHLIDSIFVLDKETNEAREKSYLHYNSSNTIVKIEKHNILLGLNLVWDLAYLNSNIKSINTRNYNYDSMTNPFFSLGLPLIDIPNLSFVEILSKNNVISSECQDYGIENYIIKYKNNYPIKKTIKNGNSVYIYKYY